MPTAFRAFPCRKTAATVIILLASCGAMGAAAAGTPWQLVDLGDLPGGQEHSGAEGINNAGQVVGFGTSSTGTRALLWDQGRTTDLGDLSGLPQGGGYNVARAINQAGQVTGLADTGNGYRAFLWQNGRMTRLGPLPGFQESGAVGLNNRGEVSGYSNSGSGGLPALWRNGAVMGLGELPGGFDSGVATDLNDAGVVVGYSDFNRRIAFAWERGRLTELEDLPGGDDFSAAYAINNAGQVVGASSGSSGTRAVLWQAGSTMDLGILGSFSSSSALGLNELGQVVGSLGSSGSAPHAFLWEKGRMQDLNQLEGVSHSGWTLTHANDINDVGQIVGYGLTPSGDPHAFLLTPVPEPSSAVLLLIGLLGAVASRARLRAHRAGSWVKDRARQAAPAASQAPSGDPVEPARSVRGRPVTGALRRRCVHAVSFLLALACSSAVHAAVVSGPILNPANGHTYYLVAQADWSASESEAISLGGHLATIDDAAENAWITATFGAFEGTARALWIGLNDAAIEGAFVWSSGAPVQYTNWGPNEPNDHLGIEDWVHLFPSTDNRFPAWNDAPDVADAFGYTFNGVVEVPAIPEPAAVFLLGAGLAALASRRARQKSARA